MATKSWGFLLVLISVIVGALLVLALQGSGILDSIFTPKGIRAVLVGPGPEQLNYPKLKISKGGGEVVVWVAKTKTDKVRIEFQNEIFEGMTQLPNGRWRPKDCGGARVCYSGEIKDGTEYSRDGYKYWQILIDSSNVEHSADGRIIIDP